MEMAVIILILLVVKAGSVNTQFTNILEGHITYLDKTLCALWCLGNG